MQSTQSGNKSIHKLLALLEAFSLQDPWLTIPELAELLDLPRVSLYRFVNPLVERNYLQYDQATKRYAPGVAFFHLGQVALHTMHFSHALPDILDEMARQIPHTLTAAVLRGNQIVYIDKRESSAGLKVGADIGAALPVYHGGGGKMFMAYMEPTQAAAIIEGAKNDPHSILPPAALDALARDLPLIRQQGYVILPGETIAGLMSVAAPVFNHTKTMEAALSVLIPAPLCTEEEIERCRSILVDACARLSLE